MTTESCRAWRGDLAAAATGRLDEDERTRLLAHLDGCAACRAELAELERAARLLDRVDPEHVVAPERRPVPAGLGDAIVARLHDEQSRARTQVTRRRTRFAVRVAAAVAAAAAIVLLTVGVLGGGGSSSPSVRVALSDNGAHAAARLVSDQGGTEVRFTGGGLHRGDVYWLWLTGPDGKRIGAGTFNGGRTGRFDITTYCALPYPQVRRVWVTDGANHVVLDAWVTPTPA
jgi:hypothetical protein